MNKSQKMLDNSKLGLKNSSYIRKKAKDKNFKRFFMNLYFLHYLLIYSLYAVLKYAFTLHLIHQSSNLTNNITAIQIKNMTKVPTFLKSVVVRK